jgi:hypothetical protein
MTAKDFIGEEAIHKNYGLVFVDNARQNSRTLVNITVLQRGKGWNKTLERYERYKVGVYLQKDGSRSIRWAFTNRDEHGIKDVVHIDSLEIKF